MEQPPSRKRAKLESEDDQSVRMSVTVRPTSGAAPSSSLNLPDIQQASFSEEDKVVDSPQELTQIVRFNKPPPSPTQTALNFQPPLILAGQVCVSSSTVYLTSPLTTVVTTQSSYYTSSSPVEGTSSLEGRSVSVSQHTTWSLASPPLVSSSSTSSSVPVQCQVSSPLSVTQNVQSDSTSHHTLTQSIDPLASLTPGETSQEKLVSTPPVSLDSKSTIYTESYGHIHGFYPISTSQLLATVVTATPPLMTTSPLPLKRETLSQSKLFEREENLQLNKVAEIGHTTYQVHGQTLPNMEEKNSRDVVAEQTISPSPLLQYAIPRSLTISTHSPCLVIQSDPLSIFSSKGAMTSTKEYFQESGAYPPTVSELHIPVTPIQLGEAQRTVVGPQHHTMATSQALSSALQMGTCQPISSSSVKQYSTGDSAHFISTLPSSRGSVALNEVSKTSLEQESRLITKTESQIPVGSMIFSCESTPIWSDLLYMPKPRELVPVQSTIARLHYHITCQGQSIPSFAGGSIPNAVPALSQALSSSLPTSKFDTASAHISPNSTAVSMRMSTHRPFTVTQSSNSHSFDRDPVLSANRPCIEHKGGLVLAHKSSETPLNVGEMQYNTAQTSSSIEERHLLNTVVPSLLSPLPQQTPTIVTQLPTTTHQHLVSRPSSHTLAHASPSVIGDSSTSIDPEEAGEAFREYRDGLLIAITDTHVQANRLYSYKIICRETKDRMMLPSLTSSEKNCILLDAVESRIRTHPSDFRTLLAILGREPHLCVFAERIRTSYCLRHSQRSWKSQPFNVSPTKRLNTYLINYYNCSQDSHDTKFPHLPHKTFISLAVIEKESISRADADKFTKGTLHGHADEILQKKTSIELEAVLEPPEGCQSLKLLFVEGAPGVGKSTFALEICRRQKEIKAMEKYSLVVLLRLREKRVQTIMNVSDLFYHEDSDLVQAVTEEVVSCNGRGVLFVLDGFDELPVDLRKRSFIVKLIQGKYLPACTVLVTSRPSATADLYLKVNKSKIDKHMEILGFTHDRIKQYARSMLSDKPDVHEDFLKYISNNPAIHGMMYIPLNCAIVVEIYKKHRTTSKPVPRTLTQLYTELCLELLRKYLLEKRNSHTDKLPDDIEDLPDDIKNLPDDIEDLSEDLKQQLKNLGELAFEGALKKEIVFEKLPKDCDVLGFMNMSTELYMGRKSVVSYSFLHLTLQEFLGAFYVSQLQDTEQKLLFIQNVIFSREEHHGFDPRKSSNDLDVMWRFVAGLTGLKNIGCQLLHKATNSIKSVSEFNYISKYITAAQRNYIEYDPLFLQCLLEIHNEERIRDICDTIIYKEHPHDLHGRGFSVTATSPFDCYAAGYSAAASGCGWSVVTSIKGNETIELLGCGLQAVQNLSGHLNCLELSDNFLTFDAVNHLSHFPRVILNQLCELNLSSNQLNKEAFDCLALILPCMLNLNSLDVSDNPCDPGGMVKVLQKLLSTKIKKLKLVETYIGVADIQALSQLIIVGTSLSILSIGDNDMPSETVTLLVETVLSRSSLETLELWGINLTEESASKFKLLEINKNLTNLKFTVVYSVGTNTFFNFTKLDLVAPHIAQALHTNVSLKVLEIPSLKGLQPGYFNLDPFSGIGSDGIKELSEMLRVNSTLKSLELFSSPSTTDDIFNLNNALKQNKSLRQLRWICPRFNACDFDKRFTIYTGHASDIEYSEFQPVFIPTYR